MVFVTIEEGLFEKGEDICTGEFIFIQDKNIYIRNSILYYSGGYLD